MTDSTGQDTNTIQQEENALSQPSSSDKSLIPATPTPQTGEGTPTLPGDTPTETVPADQQPPNADGTPAAPATGQPTPADKKPWFQKRIDSLVTEKHNARREAEQAKAQAAALLEQLAELRAVGQSVPTVPAEGTAPVTPVAPPAKPATVVKPGITEAEIEALVTKKAEEVARVNAFNKACNDIADAGKTEFKDFDTAVNNFNLLGGIPQVMLETLTELPNAHKVLRNIGMDPELAEKIIKLPPMKMAMELARLERDLDKPGAAKPISTAPKPITPLSEASRSQEDPEKMSTEEWVTWREKTKKSRW